MAKKRETGRKKEEKHGIAQQKGRRRQPRRLRRPASGVPLGEPLGDPDVVGGEEGGREGCRRQRPSPFAQTAAPVHAAAKGELDSPETLEGPGRRARTQTRKPSCVAMLLKLPQRMHN